MMQPCELPGIEEETILFFLHQAGSDKPFALNVNNGYAGILFTCGHAAPERATLWVTPKLREFSSPAATGR
jgi:hypothetical protein